MQPKDMDDIEFVDGAAQLLGRASSLAERVDLGARLARFQIDGTTRTNLSRLHLLQTDKMDIILAQFYRYLHQFPESDSLLKGHDEGRLRLRQKAHWQRVFRCEFDRAYVRNCLMIGLAHFHAKIPPQTYMAAYSFFHSELLRAVIDSHSSEESTILAISIGKVVMLDMSIALNAYLLDALALRS
jgi:hypothetical protein